MILSQIEVSHDPGQGAIGDITAVFALEDFLDSDDIAFGAAEDLPDDGRKLLIGRLSLRPLLPFSPYDPSNRISGEFKDLADLPDLDSPLIETQNGLLRLLGNHGNHTS